MTSSADTAAGAAERLWHRHAGEAPTPDVAQAAASACFGHLASGLGRWVGAHGYRVLFERALREAQAAHPALPAQPPLPGDDAAWVDAVRTHGVEAMGAGVVALLAALIELLGRIVGDEMAVRLVEQSAGSGRHGPGRDLTVAETDEERHG